MVTVSTKWDDPKKVVFFGDLVILQYIKTNINKKITTVSAWLQLAKWCPGTLRFMLAMHRT